MRFAAILFGLLSLLAACQRPPPAEPSAQPGSFAVHLNGRYTVSGRILSNGGK